MTYNTLNEEVEQLKAQGSTYEMTCDDNTPEGFLERLAYVTRATAWSININSVIKMHTAAMVAANKLAVLLRDAGLQEASDKAYEMDQMLDTEIHQTPLVEGISESGYINSVIWKGARHILETEGLWAAYCFTSLALRRLVNWAEDESDFMAKTRKEERWIDSQKACYQVRVVVDGMADEIDQMLIAQAQAA